MVHHIVFWNFQQKLSEIERRESGLKMKEILEGLKDKIKGIVDIQVVINELGSSNREIALFSKFETLEALNTYLDHPDHIEAGQFVRSVACDRACLDYES